MYACCNPGTTHIALCGLSNADKKTIQETERIRLGFIIGKDANIMLNVNVTEHIAFAAGEAASHGDTDGVLIIKPGNKGAEKRIWNDDHGVGTLTGCQAFMLDAEG
jgi:hypothetical protein